MNKGCEIRDVKKGGYWEEKIVARTSQSGNDRTVMFGKGPSASPSLECWDIIRTWHTSVTMPLVQWNENPVQIWSRYFHRRPLTRCLWYWWLTRKFCLPLYIHCQVDVLEMKIATYQSQNRNTIPRRSNEFVLMSWHNHGHGNDGNRRLRRVVASRHLDPASGVAVHDLLFAHIVCYINFASLL